MHVITKSCILLLWMHTLTFVKSQGNPADCTLQNFINGPLYDPNFDITPLEVSYSGGRQVRVGCNVGYTGFFKLICVEGKWKSRGSKCHQVLLCGRPPSLEDGDIKNTTKEHYNPHETIEYMCQSYYTMEGEPYRTCYNGKWTGNMRCLDPCIANEDEMRQHNITFKSSDYNKYLVHDEIVEFKCARGLPVGKVAMRQRCNSGVIVLPTCREDLS